MVDLGRTPRTRQGRSRFLIALLVGLFMTTLVAGALAQAGKSSLIGKLEGPEVVTDPAKFPKTLSEAQVEALLSAPDVAVPLGRSVYTGVLNDRGGYEADVTLSKDAEAKAVLARIAAISPARAVIATATSSHC